MTQSQGDIVVITGASAGIGRATALEFAKRGARITLLARDGERLQRTAQKVKELGGDALPLVTDVADAQAVEKAAAKTEDQFGPIDIWVNVAMVTVFSPVAEMTAEEYRRVTEVSYLGFVHGTLAALKRMRPRNKGVIVQTGSALSYRGIPLQSAYCGAKFAIRGFSDSLRAELLHEGSNIKITMVQLSAFNTPQFQWARSRLSAPPQPLPPIFQPELAARALVHAAYHHRREWCVGFPAVKTIWGTKLLPRVGDRLAARKAFSGQEDFGASPDVRAESDNLFDAAPGDYRSHGRFDERARDRSWQWRFTTHLLPITLTVLAVVIAAIVAGIAA
ncbi:SDR family oxidoreductase [Proteobacteria bacterium 005FR1]|nr:SDR family oxidoreductase [Proteobacteria bacterium 005FR1]